VGRAIALAVLALALLGVGCGGDSDDGDEVATLPTAAEPPGTEQELAFCLGRLVDPSLDDTGRYDLVAECTGLDREAIEAHPSFVACLSGLARHTPNDRAEEHFNRCLRIFHATEAPDGPPEPPE
jgi:hypothetical protein